MSRTAAYALLENGLGLTPGAVFGSNSVDTPPMRPFVIMHWGIKIPAFGTVGTDTLTVWYHDEPADYQRINDLLEQGKEIFESAVHVEGVGDFLTSASWTGDSEDLFDDGYGTIVRNSSFTVLTRRKV